MLVIMQIIASIIGVTIAYAILGIALIWLTMFLINLLEEDEVEKLKAELAKRAL